MRFRIVTVPVCVALISATLSAAFADTTVYIVRHGEKASDAADPGLTPEGKRRAEALKKTLRSASLKAVYATEYKRTKETVAPTARASGLDVRVARSADMAGLAATLKTKHDGEAVLVAGHTFTIPELLRELGVQQRVRLDVGSDYDNLFVVLLCDDGHVRFLRLHYGQ